MAYIAPPRTPRIPAWNSWPCLANVRHHQRPPPDPLSRPRRDQLQPSPLGQPGDRHRRPLPQRRLLLQPTSHKATLAKFGISIGRGLNEERTLARTERRPASPKRVHHDLRTHAMNLWRRSVPIPKSSGHPARKWLANRNLWRPELPLPGPVRWISAEHLNHDYPGAGAIISIAAQPTAWTQAWPNLPEPSCIHLVFVARRRQPRHGPRTQ